MSEIRTFTVTVANPGSGNKYYIDDVLQDTINLAEGYTYIFNYPSAHPFRFSTTSDGTHNSGSEYTTGVTVNSSTQIQITVAASAPTLYYYCSIHSGMGGQANTVDSSTWGVLQWGQNAWSDQDSVQVTLSGLSVTSSLGSLTAFNETGWGADTWGFEGWGGEIKITLPSFSATSSIGALTTAIKPGWGTLDWGENGWGTVDSAVFNLTGLSATASVGSLSPPDTAFGITGVSAQTAIGSLSIVGSVPITLSGLSLQSSLGLLSTDDHSVGLSGLSAASEVGSLTPADVMGLPALSATSATGSIDITSNLIQVPSSLSATSTIGSLTISNITGANLSGLSATSAIGSLTTVQVTNASLVGLGLSITAEVGAFNAILGYANVDPILTASYSDVTRTSGASYSDVTRTSGASYTDVDSVG